jgi:6-hydroxycyclohex-1-ene-1-carbonyl-CoA dehydrogenase
MSLQPLQWMMNAPAAPLVAANFAPSPGPGEVVVEIDGCGACYTDLGYYYDGVRTKHALPLCLGHEISGHVTATGPRAESRQGKIKLGPYVEKHPLKEINRIFEAVHHGELKRRAILVPAA